MSNYSEFRKIFIASEKEIYRYVASFVPNPDDASDIVQQTALELMEKFDSYDSSRPFTPWACRFALNVIRVWMAEKGKWQTFADPVLLDMLSTDYLQMKEDMDERLQHLDQCIQVLSEKEKQLLFGYYTDNQSIEDISGKIDKSISATYKLLQRIRHRLKACIEHNQSENKANRKSL